MKKILFKLFARIKKHSRFYPNVYLKNTENIAIGKNCLIMSRCSLIATRGKILIGNHVHLNPGVSINAENKNGEVILEDGVEINEGSLILARNKIHIKKDTIIGPSVKIISYQHNFNDPTQAIKHQGYTSEAIEIGSGTWIGANVIIMAGVTIGRNAVIGAGAIVNKDIPDFAIAIGSPARVIRTVA